MPGKPLIEKGEFRIDEISGGKIFLDQMLKVFPSFNWEVVIQKVIVERIELQGRRHLVEATQIQPLITEGADHAVAALIGQHPLNLIIQGRAMERIRSRQLQKFFIGNRKPQNTSEFRGFAKRRIGMLPGRHQESW